MGKSAGSAPETPDPTKLIPIQSAANRDAFNYQTDASRFNNYGPDSSQTWDKRSVFDQTGYDNALKSWATNNSQGTWVPESQGPGQFEPGSEGSGNYIPGATIPGHWSGSTSDGNLRPTQDQFTSYKYGLTTKLSPEAQKLHDAQQGQDTQKNQLAQSLLAKLGGSMGSAFDTSGAPGLKSNLNLNTDPGIAGFMEKFAGLDPKSFSDEAADAAYRQQTRYLDPQVKQQQQALEARLSEQGFVPGTPGYARAMETMMDTNNRAYGSARDSSILQGFDVGHTQFGDSASALNSQIGAALQGAGFTNDAALKDATFQNTTRQQSIAELLQQRQVPMSDLNTVMSFLGGGGGATNAGTAAIPQGGVGALQTPDQLDAYNQQYQGLMDKYNADVNSDNATTSTMGSIVGMLALAF
jgi:hypothetical protein